MSAPVIAERGDDAALQLRPGQSAEIPSNAAADENHTLHQQFPRLLANWNVRQADHVAEAERSGKTAFSEAVDDGRLDRYLLRQNLLLNDDPSELKRADEDGQLMTMATTADPLCAGDVDPFGDCLPSDVKALRNFATGTRQHVAACL
jgi:hypothetical protein